MAFSDPALEARLAQRMGKASTPSGSMISGTQFSDPALEQRLKQRMSQPRQQRQQAPQPVAQAQPIIAKPKSRLDPKKEALKWAANTGLNLVQGFSKTAEYAASTIGKQLLDTVVKKNPVTAIASLTVPKQYKKLNDQWKDYIRKNEQKLPAAQVSKAVEKLSQNEYLQPSKEWQQAQQTDWKKLFTKEHLPETILQVSPSIVSSIITAISTGGSGVFITTAGSTAQDVKSDAINYGVSEGKAESLGLATGLAVGYLDKALPDKLFGDPAVKQAFLKGILRKLGNSVLLEAGTETTQEAVQLAAEKTFRDDLGWEEAKTRAALSAFGGAFGGGAMQTVASFFNKTRTEIIEDDQTMLDYLKEKTGSATLTPQQAMGTIVGTPLENTPEGNEVMKVALQAQDEDKQVKITTSEGKVTAEIVDPVQNQEPQDVRKEFIEKELQPKEETVDPNLASIRTTEDGSTVIRPENIRDGEVAGFKELEKSPDKMIDDFIAKFGNKVGADEAKTMFDGYNETNSMDYDRVSGALSQAVLDRLIIEAGNKPGSVLIMSGGGTGSGKSSTLRNYVSNSGPFYDSTFSSIDRAVKNTENALANGLDVDVHFVYRNPVEAFKDGVMQRYRDGEARTVPVSRHLSSHENAIKTILEYSDKYEDNPKVNVQIYRNVTGQKAKVIPIDTLRELDYNSLEYKKELEGYVEKEYQDGNITREQAAALLERKIRDDVKNDERKPQETRPAKSKPAKVVAKTSPQEELKQKYQENQQAVEEALSQVWTELDAAQAGSRVTIDGKVQGIKSTFPSWVPEYFRSRDLFDATLARLATVLDNPEYPPTSKPKLRDLYDVILDQIDYVAEIDTRDIRNKLLEASDAKTNKTKDTTIARKDDSSPKRAEAAEPKQKPEKESIIDSNEKESSNQTTRPQDKPGDSPETVSESPGKQAVDRGADSDSSGKVAGRRRSDSDKRLGDGSSAPVNQVELNKQIEDLVNERGDNPNKYSDEEKKLLKRYTGSGGLEKQGATGKGLLDEYYTPKEIVNEIWQRLETIGYGKQDIVAVVEPAIGIGSFIDRNMDGHRVIGFETNPISAKIARIVNDDKPIQVHNQSFEEVFMSNRGVPVSVEPFADLVVGNPPYGKHRGLFKGLGEEPKIKSYEEYFVKRGLDVLKDGGLLAYVMPSTWLNSDISYGKQAIASMGELVEAFRLPKGAFKTTSIGTDIVIFKKGGTTNLSDLTNGTYFADNPDAVLGTVSVGTGQWGSDEVKGTLDDAIERMRSYEKPAKVAEVVEDPENIAEIIEEQRQEKIQADEESQSTEEPPTDNKTIAPKVKADVANKALITTTKKGKTMLVSDGLSNDDLTIWSSVTATGELNQEYTKNFKPEAFESEQVFIDMSSGSAEYFPSVTYVAGNIYEKLDQLESFKDSIFPGQYTRQKKALEAAIPATISVKEMTLQPNSRYVKEIQFTNEDGEQTSLREMFIKYVQKLPMQAFGSSSSWEIVGYVQGTVVNSGDKVRNVEIRKRRRELGKQLFKRFIIEELSDDQQKIIEKAFNRNFNGYYRPDYTKIPLVSKVFTTFNPKQKKVVDKLEVKPIQKEGAAFLASKGVGLLAYDVGVGKTLTGIVAINEVMQRGWAKKPLIIVPNSTYQNWINEILELIPGVKINSLKNLGGGFKGDLNTLEIEDGTLSIMTYEGLNKLGFKDETYNEIGKDLKDVMSGFNTTKRGEESEGAKADEMTGIAAKGTSSERFFEDLGFDHITVDEVHNFKNIFAGAKLEGERGGNEYRNIRGTSSMRGIKAYFMAQYIMRRNNNRNVFLLSATPFTNSPMEIYSIISLMGKGKLERLGIRNVNDFMSMFVDLKATFAVKANGDVKEEDVVEQFNNLQQLQKIVTEYIDFRTGEEAGVNRPDRVKRPFFLSINQMQRNYMQQAEKLFNDKEKGILPAITEMQKITLSPYLSQYHAGAPTATEFVENSPKIKFTMEMIKTVKRDNPDTGQVIYMPRGPEYFPLMKEYLVKKLGYKDSQVTVIAGGMSINNKDKIMADFNSGKIKVLIGTETIKEGVNLQERATELYYLHLPWNPTDMLQVEGRIWRQGNKYDKVRINYPLLANSIDSFIFQKLETKEKRIANLWSYKGNTADVSDINFEESKLDLITDPIKRLIAEETFETAKQRSKVTSIKSDIAFADRQLKQHETVTDNIEWVTKKLADPTMSETSREYNEKQLKKYKQELAILERRLKVQNISLEDIATKKETLAADLVKEEELYKQLSELYKQKRGAIKEEEVSEAVLKPNDWKKMADDYTRENKTFWLKKERVKKKASSSKSAANTDSFSPTMRQSRATLEEKKTREAVSIPFPEMVALANELMGKYPTVHAKPGKKFGGQVNGLFIPDGEGSIRLNANLFTDVDQAAKTLAHEMGHLADYIPDKTLKRGNLLGRIGSMNKFMRGVFTNPEVEAKIDTLLAKKKSLQAERKATADKKVRSILLKQIKGINTEVDALQKNAIKNKNVFAELWELSKQWRPLQREEMMVNAATGKMELVTTNITEEQAPEDYLTYRKSSRELYADALSVLLNDPAMLKQAAPTFWTKFIEQLDRKPIVKDNLFATWDLLNEPQDVILERRLSQTYKSFKEAKAKRSDILNEQKPKRPFMETLMQNHITVFDPIYKKLEKRFKDTGIVTSPKAKMRMQLEEMQMRRNESYLYIDSIIKDINTPLKKIGLTEDDLGALLMLERGLGDRKDIANPYGLQGNFSQETLDYLQTYLQKHRDISAEQFTVLQQIAKKFREYTFSKVEAAAEVGVYSQKFFNETAKPNKDTYVTYQVIEYIHENYVSAGIKHAVGTVKPIENPIVSTILKTMAVIEQVEMQKGKLAVIDELKANFPGDISDAKAIRPQGVRVGWRPEKNRTHLEYYKDGAKAAVNVDPYIAEMFNTYTPTEMHTAVKVSAAFNRLFKPLVTTYNISWGFFSNIFRDTGRTYKNLNAVLPTVGKKQGMSIFEYFYRFVRAIPEGKNFQKNNITPLLREMLANKAFSMPFTGFDTMANEAEWMKPVIKRYAALGDDPKQTSMLRKVLKPLLKAFSAIEFAGSVLESTSKIAGYQVVSKRVESGREAGFITRNYVGTPNYVDGGTQKQIDNNIFVFSNVMLQALRNDISLAKNPTTASGYWMRTFQINILPKLAMLAGAAGLFGDAIKEIYSKATEYDKTNYLIIPIGIRKNGKVTYARIPQDETGRFFAAVVWKLGSYMMGDLKKPGQIASLGAGFIPSMTPLWSIAGAWQNYVQGRNPYDEYRGRLVIDDTNWSAGGVPRLTKMVQWTIGEAGIWQFNTYDDATNTTFDVVVEHMPIINRAIKSTDYGLTEKEKQLEQQLDQDSARRILKERELLQDAIEKTRANPEQQYEVGKQLIKNVLGEKIENSTDKRRRTNLIKKYEVGLLKGSVSREMDSLIEADNNAYKLKLLELYKKTLPADEYLNLKKTAVDNKVISDELRKEYLKMGL